MKLRFYMAPAFSLLLSGQWLAAQSYHAIHGSPYAGSTGIRNNPAASVNAAYKWDVTLFTAQAKLSTNSVRFDGTEKELLLTDGYFSRFMHNNIDLSIFNALYKPNNRQAFAFNLRARSYNHVKTLPIYASDTIYSLHQFLRMNRTTAFLEGFGTHSGWLEGSLNYSQVLGETQNSRLTGGITLHLVKGVSGAFGKMNRLSYIENKNATDTTYIFITGGGSYGYSANYDETSAGSTASAKEFLKNTFTRPALSLGVEYLLYNNDTGPYNHNNVLNYAWKIGFSLMDIGANAYKASDFSSQFRNPNLNSTDINMDNKFSGIQTGRDLRDTLATVFNITEPVGERFTISNPTRLALNVDRSFGNNLYINAEMSMNFYSTSSYRKLRTRELNFLTVTPRWETVGWGFYLPVQYNTQGQFWVGAAVKAGPLLLGLHNIKWMGKMENISGGGYIMLSLHPFNKKRIVSKLDCPE